MRVVNIFQCNNYNMVNEINKHLHFNGNLEYILYAKEKK